MTSPSAHGNVVLAAAVCTDGRVVFRHLSLCFLCTLKSVCDKIHYLFSAVIDPAKEKSAIQLARHLAATAGKLVNPTHKLLPAEINLASSANCYQLFTVACCVGTNSCKNFIWGCTLYPVLHVGMHRPAGAMFSQIRNTWLHSDLALPSAR